MKDTTGAEGADHTHLLTANRLQRWGSAQCSVFRPRVQGNCRRGELAGDAVVVGGPSARSKDAVDAVARQVGGELRCPHAVPVVPPVGELLPIGLKREFVRGGVAPPFGVDLEVELPGSVGKRMTDPVVAPVSLSTQKSAHNSVRHWTPHVDASRRVCQNDAGPSRECWAKGTPKRRQNAKAPRYVGERCEVLVPVVNEAGTA